MVADHTNKPWAKTSKGGRSNETQTRIRRTKKPSRQTGSLFNTLHVTTPLKVKNNNKILKQLKAVFLQLLKKVLTNCHFLGVIRLHFLLHLAYLCLQPFRPLGDELQVMPELRENVVGDQHQRGQLSQCIAEGVIGNGFQFIVGHPGFAIRVPQTSATQVFRLNYTLHERHFHCTSHYGTLFTNTYYYQHIINALCDSYLLILCTRG